MLRKSNCSKFVPFQVFPLILCYNQIFANPDPAKVQRILIVEPPKPPQQNASAKNDFRELEDLGAYAKRDGFPQKVIQVTKTVAVQIPIPVPIGFYQQQNQASKQSQTYVQNPLQSLLKKGTTPRPMVPMKINSPEMHAVKNSIWQQNFPPNPAPKSRIKLASTTAAPELAPTAGSITITQNPMTKAVSIEIPWNAAMKESFLDEISKNPNPLLFSLNLIPNQQMDTSSYAAPPAGIPSNFGNSGSNSGQTTSGYSSSFDSSTQTFYPESGPSPGQVQFTRENSSPPFNDFLQSQQFSSTDSFPNGSNSTHYFRLVEKKPQTQSQTTVSHGSNDIFEHRPSKPRHRKPLKPIDIGKYNNHHSGSSGSSSSNTFNQNLSFENFEIPSDTNFANSDILNALREYEKRVEKDLSYERSDPSDSDGGYSMDSSVIIASSALSATATPRTSRLRSNHPSSNLINPTFRPKRKKKIAKVTITKAV